MRFELVAASPVAGIIVMVDVAKEQAGLNAVEYEANIAADAGGSEVLVPDFVQAMELKAGLVGAHLKFESGDPGCLLLVGGQTVEAFEKSTGGPYVHD